MPHRDELIVRWLAAGARALGKKAKGRPKAGVAPPIDWKLGETLFVQGELVGKDENTNRIFPSYREIGMRIGTSAGNVQQFSKRYNWRGKRADFLNGVTPPGDEAKFLGPGAKPRKRSRAEAVEVCLAYIDDWERARETGNVPVYTVSDLDKVVRLLAFCRGQADSTRVVHVSVSLESMQERHKALREHVQAHVDDEVAGVLTQGDPSEGHVLERGEPEEVEGELVERVPRQPAA